MGKNPWVSFDKLTEFEQTMLLRDGIDIDEITDLRLTAEILKRYQIYVLIDLFIDIQFTLYKLYLHNTSGIEFSDDEVYSMASSNISKELKYKDNLLKLEGYKEEDIERINHDIALINALRDDISLDLKEMKIIFPNFKAMVYFASEKSCIDNINLKHNLQEIGLNDYSKKVITRLLGEEAYQSLGKNNFKSENYTSYKDIIESTNSSLDNFKNGLKINISKTKMPIKKLIKKYNKEH